MEKDYKTIAEKAIGQWFAYQNPIELEFSMRVVAAWNPKVIVEIGTAHNGSLAAWAASCTPDVVVGIDPLTLPKTQEQLLSFNNLVKTYGIQMIPYRSTQQEAHAKLKEILAGRKVDFLFIDAEHGYEDVMADFMDYLPYMNTPSLIGFNDIYFSEVLSKAGTGVWRLWEELKREYNYDEIHYHSSMGNGFIYWPEKRRDNFL